MPYEYKSQTVFNVSNDNDTGYSVGHKDAHILL